METLSLIASATAQASDAGMQHHTSPILQTLGAAIVLGVTLVLLSRRLGISSIVLLLIGGVLAGPQVFGWVQPSTLRGRAWAVD